jgi:hypothetical protein
VNKLVSVVALSLLLALQGCVNSPTRINVEPYHIEKGPPAPPEEEKTRQEAETNKDIRRGIWALVGFVAALITVAFIKRGSEDNEDSTE